MSTSAQSQAKHPEARSPKPRTRSRRGQALVEFAILLPLLAGLAGGVIDFARVYQASMALQSATRNAAESAATTAATSEAAQTEAQRVVCTETQRLPGFTPGTGGSIPACTAPDVTVTSFTYSTSGSGFSASYPLVSTSVHSELDFSLMVPWPFIEDGTWTLSTTQSFSVVQNR
jgi:Flp pilus assembly protein TadG